MVGNSEVINWDEAMQQVGEDEEFLRELLEDLKTEVETQVTTISAIIQNPQENPYHQITRAAHVIKGAAANLMCGQLRAAAFQLEHAANVAHSAGAAHTAEQQQAVQAGYVALQQAAQSYLAFLKSVGIE